jgi:uncharacterized membrane protein
LLKYAWDQGWINPTPTMRVVAAIATGVVLSAVGERMHRRRMRVLAATFHGAGLAIVLASFFGAYALFPPDRRVLGVPGAFAGVVLTALAGVMLSLHVNTIVLAVIALIGAYIAPFILNTGQDRSAQLLAYVGVLSAVAWALSYLKPRWLGVRVLAWVGTFGTFAAWWADLGLENNHHALARIWLAVYYLGFLAEMVFTLRKTEAGGTPVTLDMVAAMLSLVNTAAAFGLCRAIHSDSSHDLSLGIVAIVVALIVGAAALATHARGFSISCLLQAAALLTLAVPLILDQFAITLAWLALAVAMAVLAWQLNLPAARAWAVVLLLLCIARLFLFDQHLQRDVLLAVQRFSVSQWMLLACAIALMAHAIAWMRSGAPGRIPALEQRFARIIPPPTQWAARAPQGMLDYAQPAPSSPAPRLDIAGIIISAIGTLVYAVAVMDQYHTTTKTLLLLAWPIPMLALARLATPLSYLWHAAVVTALVAVRWFAVDGLFPLVRHWDSPQLASLRVPFTNLVSLNGLVLCGLLGALIIQCSRSKPRREFELRTLSVAIGLVILAMLNFEACRTVDWLWTRGTSMRDPGIVKHGVMSVLWALVGFSGVAIGFWKKIAPLRVAALVLLGVTLVKILVIDMAEVKAVWRILSFVAVGGLLLAVSYVYHQQMQARKAQGEASI